MRPGKAEREPLLVVEDLRAHFQTERGVVRAVDGVSLSLMAGRTLGLVGESGCGKSVFMRALLGLLPRSAHVAGARVRLEGRALDVRDERQMRRVRGRQIAMIFQDPMSTLNPVMKVGRQIGESLALHLGLHGWAARRRAGELLAAVGISMAERRLHQYPHQLSGGIRQRVAIAIALAGEPKLLIADEPTTALDVTVQAEILDLLQRQQEQRRMAMILITHDLGVVAGRADEIAVMYAGKIVERAPTAALFSNMRMPYTEALMNSIPRLEDPPHTRLQAIAGRPPDLIAPAAGCRFAPRCPLCHERCRAEEPPLATDGRPDHAFACWTPVGRAEAAS